MKNKSETSKRLALDHIAKSKYNASKDQDEVIISRARELADKKGLTTAQIALGWLLTKVTAPVVGATKVKHIEDAVEAIGVTLTQDEIKYLEESYVPHPLVGVMSFNHK